MTNKNKWTNMQGRLFYVVIWLPVLLIPAVYLLLIRLTNDNGSEQWTWDTIDFYLPFIIVFLVHDRLLVRYLFLRKRQWLYWLSVAALVLTFLAYSIVSREGTLEPENRRDEPAMTDTHDHDDAPMTADAPPQRPRERPHKGMGPNPPRDNDGERRPGHDRKGPDPALMDFFTVMLLIGSDLAIVLYTRYLQERKRNDELENSKLHQELEYLKAQINPHFFMNMLNNIHGMVEIDAPKAQEMIMQLSKMMRYVLYEGSQEYTPLSEEITFISNYIEMNSKRFSSRKVSIEMQLPEQVDSAIEVPPMLFVVLIENAFKHGVSYRSQCSFLFNMHIKNGRIEFVCRNNRFPHKEDPAHKGGIGLVNLRKRLQLLYGDNYTYITDETETTYTATLKIPYKQ